MGRYIVMRPYQSHVGSYAVGRILELEDDLAAWLLRDMAGVIEPIPEQQSPQPEQKAPVATPKARRPRKAQA